MHVYVFSLYVKESKEWLNPYACAILKDSKCNVFAPVRLEGKIRMVENRHHASMKPLFFWVLKTLLRSCLSVTMFHPAAAKLYLHGLILSSIVR